MYQTLNAFETAFYYPKLKEITRNFIEECKTFDKDTAVFYRTEGTALDGYYATFEYTVTSAIADNVDNKFKVAVSFFRNDDLVYRAAVNDAQVNTGISVSSSDYALGQGLYIEFKDYLESFVGGSLTFSEISFNKDAL